MIAGMGLVALRVWSGSSADEVGEALFTKPVALESADGMVHLPAGEFLMGDASGEFADARPTHLVRVTGFWIDRHPVTNRQFELFIQETAYETTAELRGSSLVFDRRTHQWTEVAGANWKFPEGPTSTIIGREDHPVVHVSWRDAATYADWADKRLPTEAEFEYAARGGLMDFAYPWGQQLVPAELHRANGWQGHFPEADSGDDGFMGTSPVGNYPPNRFGLADIAGNVWQWCADWYDAETYAAQLGENPRGPNIGRERVRRGGSWLSTRNYGGNLQLAYRDHATPDTSTNHTGFRCVQSE